MMKIVNCPKCESKNIRRRAVAVDKDTVYDICGDCLCCWESIPAGEHFKRDGEMLPFKEPCDNCAFRAGSSEIEDRTEWKQLLTKLKSGGKFFCHKGVPLDKIQEGHKASFEFPKKENGQWDTEKMRLCRGYLNAWYVWTMKKVNSERDAVKERDIL